MGLEHITLVELRLLQGPSDPFCAFFDIQSLAIQAAMGKDGGGTSK